MYPAGQVPASLKLGNRDTVGTGEHSCSLPKESGMFQIRKGMEQGCRGLRGSASVLAASLSLC